MNQKKQDKTGLDKIGDGDLDEAVHDVFSARAAEVNNKGVQAQVAFLRGNGMTDEQIAEAAGC